MRRLSRILLITVLLTGCSGRLIFPSQTPPDNTVTPAMIAIPPTATQLVMPGPTPTATLQPISAPAATYIDPSVESKCVVISQDIQDNNIGNGLVVLESRRTGADNLIEAGLYLLNIRTGALTTINDLKANDGMLWSASVSPDGSTLAVRAGYPKFLMMTANGIVKKELPRGKGWASDAIWQDNQHLMINIAGLDPDESKVSKPAKMLWLNPFTGEQRILAPDFPNIYADYPLPDWDEPWGTSLVVYNPQLTRAVYLAEPGVTYVLWDMQKKKALINWTNRDTQHHPRWSPDGSKFLMDVTYISKIPGDFSTGLYLVDDNGKVSMPAILDTKAEQHISITDYFWSPSGRYVALLAFGDENSSTGESKSRLLVLDSQTRQIVDYCLEFNLFGASEASLIWSPDDTQILLNDKYNEGPRRRRVILVDLAKGTAFPIAEDVIATGWMKSP
jgi:dipeptidyl aminopeptidase/acylaminoacyl peptidase